MSKKKVKKITDFSAQPAPVKKVKEQPVSEQITSFDKVELWLTTNWKLTVAVLCAAAVVIVAVVVARHVSDAADRKAKQEIADATTAAELTAVIEKYASHPASVLAEQKLAAKYIEEKEYAKAYDVLKKISDSASVQPFVRTRAALDCAGLQEMLGAYPVAISEWTAILSDPMTEESQKAEAAYHAARLTFAQGKPADALKIIEDSINLDRAGVSSDAYSLWAAQAQSLKDLIENAAAEPAKKAEAVKAAVEPAKKAEAVKKAAEAVPAAQKK